MAVEHFSSRARRIILRARRACLGYGHSQLMPAHLLLGLLQEPDGIGAEALTKGFKVEPTRVEARVVQCLGSSGPALPTDPNDLPLSGAAMEVVRAAGGEVADDLDVATVGSEHILMALIRDRNSFVAKLLVSEGVELSQVRDHIQYHGGPVQSAQNAQNSTGPSPLEVIEFVMDWGELRDEVREAVAAAWTDGSGASEDSIADAVIAALKQVADDAP